MIFVTQCLTCTYQEITAMEGSLPDRAYITEIRARMTEEVIMPVTESEDAPTKVSFRSLSA